MSAKYDPLTGELLPQSAANAAPQSPSFTPQNLTDDELRALAIEKLSIALQAIDPVAQPEMTRKLAAEVKDRLDGKPGQVIHQTNETTITLIADEQRQLAVDEVREALRLLRMPAIEQHKI